MEDAAGALLNAVAGSPANVQNIQVNRNQIGSTHHEAGTLWMYFEPPYEEFSPRTMWSLSNAFTSAFKELNPIPQFKATAKLGGFLEARFSGSF
jgi:hypothetical protein